MTYQPPERFEDTLWFGFDIQNRQELYPAMQRLLAHFCQFLTNTQLTSNIIEWRLRPQHLIQTPPDHAKRKQATVRMGARASQPETTAFKVFSDVAQHNAQLWFELSCLQLDNQHLPENIEGISLVVDQLAGGGCRAA